MAASRTQTDPPDADEILRRRLIAQAEGQIARIEGALRPKRADLLHRVRLPQPLAAPK